MTHIIFFLFSCSTKPLSIMCCILEKQQVIVRKRWWRIRASLGALTHCPQYARYKDTNLNSKFFFTPTSLSISPFCLCLFPPFLSLNLFHPLTLWAGATVISHYLTIKSQELIKWPRSAAQSTFPLSPAP